MIMPDITCKLIIWLNYKADYLNMPLLSKVFVSGQCKSWFTVYAQWLQANQTNKTVLGKNKQCHIYGGRQRECLILILGAAIMDSRDTMVRSAFYHYCHH